MGAKLSKAQYGLEIAFTQKPPSEDNLDDANLSNDSASTKRDRAGIAKIDRSQILGASRELNAVGVLPRSRQAILAGHLQSQHNIDLCSKNISAVSPNIAFFSKATKLQLCCNLLTSLPNEIGYLRELKVLHISRNQLEELPESIGFLSELIELRLDGNKLKYLPKSIIALSKLQILNIEANLLEELPAEIAKLAALVTLELSGNPIRVLPAEILRLKQLRRLRLENCALASSFSDPEPLTGTMTLKELAARTIVRNNLQIIPELQSSLKFFLLSTQECSFCGGPFFDHYAVRGKMVSKNEFLVPVVYRLCTAHWNNEKQRIRSLFRPVPSTAPQYSLAKCPSSGSLMNYFSYTMSPYRENLTRSSSNATIPLAYLSPAPSAAPLNSSGLSRLQNRSVSTLELPVFDESASFDRNVGSNSNGNNAVDRPRSKSFSNLLK